ncbi:MAG: hypothetical protein ABIW76_10035 [Fibrobacteria bacterium]
MPEQELQPSDDVQPDSSSFEALDKEERSATISWYLVTTGIIALVLAGLCLWMGRIGATSFFSHKDFALNPVALGRSLLLVGIILYAAGRILSYYRRFRKR